MRKILFLMFIITISIFGISNVNYDLEEMRTYYVEGVPYTGVVEGKYQDFFTQRGEYRDGFLEKVTFLDGDRELGYSIWNKGELVSKHLDIDWKEILKAKDISYSSKKKLEKMKEFKYILVIEDDYITIKQSRDNELEEKFAKIKLIDSNGKYEDLTSPYSLNFAGVGYIKKYEDGQLISYNLIDYDTKHRITDEEFYKNGQLKFKINYIDGMKAGEYKEYFDNGQVATEGNYKNDRRVGTWKRYYKTGATFQIIEYGDEGVTGSVTEFYDTGELYAKGRMIEDKASGFFDIYDKNKNLLKETLFYSGKEVGSEIEYTPIGREFYKNYFEGCLYKKNGEIIPPANPKSFPTRRGEYEIYYDNGYLKEKVTYRSDIKRGVSTIYDRNGMVLEVVDYNLEYYDIGKFKTLLIFLEENPSISIFISIIVILLGVRVFRKKRLVYNNKL